MLGTLLAATITVTQALSPISIDGHLDEAAWQKATVVSTFYEVMPGDNLEPPVRTEAFITYDSRNFYVGFKCYDPEPGKIRAHLGDHDSGYGDDRVGVLIDTFHDQRRGYEFFANIMGVKTDVLRSETTGEDSTWDTIWDSAGQFTDFGYTVEIAIPFKSVRFHDTEEQVWGITLFRDYHRLIRHQIASSKLDRNLNCFICQWDTMQGMTGIRPGRNIEIIPSLTAQRDDARETPESEMTEGDEDVEASLSLMWGPTPDMTLNATLNPDFSQVESDVMQMDINTRFALFYPEKRPFFMEGSDFFATPFSILYTRSIADPDWGLKMTGKEGDMAYGVMAASDDTANFLIPGNQYSWITSWDQEVISGVFRIRQDIGKNNSLGLIGTHRGGGSYHNSVLGLDGRFFITDSDVFTFQWFITDTAYPTREEKADFNGEKLRGDGLYAGYSHSTKEWDWSLSYLHMDPELRVDMGFEPRVDIKRLSGNLYRSFWGEKDAFFSVIRPGVYANYYWDYDHNLTDREFGIELSADMPLQTSAEVGILWGFVLFNGKEYQFPLPFIWASMRPSKYMTLYAELIDGETVDFSNDRLGDRWDYRLEATFQPGKHLSLSGTFSHRELSISEGRVFSAGLYIFRVNYHLNRRAFIRALVQYQDVQRNSALYLEEVAETDRVFSSQLLFSYRINPFTLMYLGYSDRGFEDDWVDRTTTNRSFFFKVSYAFRP